MPLSKEEIQALYTREAERYDSGIVAVRRIFGSRYLDHLAQAVDALGIEPGDTVVDLACGTGLNFERILERTGSTGRVIGVDITAAMLHRAKDRIEGQGWRNVELVHSDAAVYPFPRGVQRILSTAGITLVPEYDEVIARASEAMAPGGRLVVYDFKIPDDWPEWRIQIQMRIRARFGQTRDLGRTQALGVDRPPFPNPYDGRALRGPGVFVDGREVALIGRLQPATAGRIGPYRRW